MDNAKKKVNEKAMALFAEKKKHHASVVKLADERKAFEKTADEFHNCIDELHAELSDAKLAEKEAEKSMKLEQRKLSKVKTVAVKRLEYLKSLKVSLNKAKEDIVDESHQRAALERMRKIHIEIKKERPIGRRGGGKRWPVHIVLLICEMLVNGTHTSAVPANIQTSSAAFTGFEADELPLVNFVRECPIVLQNLNETLSALRLGSADTWNSVFTDGTARRQIAMQNLFVALMEDVHLDAIIVL